MTWSVPVFIGVTLLFMGGCAFMTGNALARTWRPWWHGALYALGLGAADRFIGFALFGGSLFSLAGYVVDTAVLEVITLAAWRVTLAKRMCDQYPWLYERSGLFEWRERMTHHAKLDN